MSALPPLRPVCLPAITQDGEIDDDGVQVEKPEEDYEDDFPSPEALRDIAKELDAVEISAVPANPQLQMQLKSLVARDDPAELMRFIAHNTNPNQLRYSWDNLLAAAAECFSRRSLWPLLNVVLSQNCVYCARAVQQTLQCTFDRTRTPDMEPRLVQVELGSSAVFYEIFNDDKVTRTPVEAYSSQDYIALLKSFVKADEYCCITVPVASVDAKISHAMNIVNAGPGEPGKPDRIFILCGQSGTVFDLSDDMHVEKFCAKYSNKSSRGNAGVLNTPAKGASTSRSVEAQANLVDDVGAAAIQQSRLPAGALVA